jgi:hypothetical protein
MDGGEEALKTAGISYVQPNWFADSDWFYLLARLRGYFSSIWKISQGLVIPTVYLEINIHLYLHIYAYMDNWTLALI